MAQSNLHIKIDEYEPESFYDSSSPAPAVQARKPDRACDFCRKRKTRCDGALTPNSKCSNCRRNQCPCTYQEASRPRGPPKAYVTALEDRMERFEKLLKRLRPEADFTDVLGPPLARGSWRSEQPRSHQKDREGSVASSSKSSTSHHSGNFTPSSAAFLKQKESQEHGQISPDDSTSSSDDEFGAEGFPRSRLRIRSPSQGPAMPDETSLRDVYSLEDEMSVRFHGKSSFFPLIQATRKLASAKPDDSLISDNQDIQKGTERFPYRRREAFWALPPWEKAWGERAAGHSYPSSSSVNLLQNLPPSDLMLPLLSLYFHYTNINFPLLHPPTFYAQFRDGLHLKDPKFAAVVWCMMANGARWSDDQRVLWDGWGKSPDSNHMEEDGESVEWAGAGWRFFLRGLDSGSFFKPSPDPPSLFELQYCSLGAMFLRGTSLHPGAWIFIGSGLRKVMDVGAHRKKVYKNEPNAEDELWKRAFWMLVLFDRLGSASLGRPCCAREEDFDLDYPLEVDDEYWVSSDASTPAFQQPPGRPSRISAFVCMAKLSQIMAFAIRTIYCIDKSKVLLGLVSDDWQGQIVSQLNTALDEWVESIPEHLRWSPSMKDDVFSSQSSLIYSTYYLTLILIYRPFGSAQKILPCNDVPGKTRKPFPFPADSICAIAAHSATVIVDAQVRRGSFFIPNMISVAQMCSVVQLMNWYAHVALKKDQDLGSLISATEKREQEQAMEDVEKCIRCLELAESRWIMARKFLYRIRESLPAADPSSNSGEGIGSRSTNAQNYATGAPMPSSFAPPLQQRHSPPVPGAQDPEQALMSDANWRWFQENTAFQERMGKRRTPEALRHHVPVPLHQSTPPPNTGGQRGYSGPTHGTRYVAPYPIPPRNQVQQSGLSRSASRSSTAGMANVATFVPDQPISSMSRLGRTSRSRQFLNVSTPQSAAREEPAAWRPMDLPKHPYETVQQAALGRQHEHRSQPFIHHQQR